MEKTTILRLALALCACGFLYGTPAQAAPDCSNYSNSNLMSWPAADPVWEFCWRRPQLSQPSGDGSGIELFEVMFNGHLVFQRANVPILNVEYGPGGCGCFRDWLDNEVRFEAIGSPCSNGYCETTQPTRTICDCAPTNTCDSNPSNACNVDIGTFEGVAAEIEPSMLTLVSQTSAGWYRYTVKWRFHLDGTIEPIFGYGARPNGCTDANHFHHSYYRFDFDIDGPANDQVYSEDSTASGSDADGDGIDDTFDNCVNDANSDQQDSNGDGFGNICDADLNNDNTVDFLDLGQMKALFFGSDADADLNSDGTVDFLDLGRMKQLFFGTPGPAGSGSTLTAINSEATGFAVANEQWVVKDTNTGRGYRLIPGSSDHILVANTFDPVPFAESDYWVLAERSSEVVDDTFLCQARLDDYMDSESTADTDVVFWYRLGVNHVGMDECFCGLLGPRLEPVGDWSP